MRKRDVQRLWALIGRLSRAQRQEVIDRLKSQATPQGQWLDQAQALADGLTVKRAAGHLNVAPSTSFRWLHRFLAVPRSVKLNALAGVAEIDETYVVEPFKGAESRGAQGPKARRQCGQARPVPRADSRPGRDGLRSVEQPQGRRHGRSQAAAAARSKQAATPAKQPSVTQQLDAVFDHVGPDALCLPFAQALAEAHGRNRTSAGIRFNRWLAARTAPAGQQLAA